MRRRAAAGGGEAAERRKGSRLCGERKRRSLRRDRRRSARENARRRGRRPVRWSSSVGLGSSRAASPFSLSSVSVCRALRERKTERRRPTLRLVLSRRSAFGVPRGICRPLLTGRRSVRSGGRQPLFRSLATVCLFLRVSPSRFGKGPDGSRRFARPFGPSSSGPIRSRPVIGDGPAVPQGRPGRSASGRSRAADAAPPGRPPYGDCPFDPRTIPAIIRPVSRAGGEGMMRA